MSTAELIRASHAMDKAFAELRRVEAERDQARVHLQAVVTAYGKSAPGAPDHPDLADAMALADIWLKGGV